MTGFQKIFRACSTIAARSAMALAAAFAARSRPASATVQDAANTDPGVIPKPGRIDKYALAAMYLQARFPVVAQQYLVVLNAGDKISGPLRTELFALSRLANAFGFSLSVGRLLLIGKDAKGGVVGPAA